MKICPKCNREYEDDDNFCKVCGIPLKEEKQEVCCAKCGAMLEDGANFCPKCGAKVGEDAEQNAVSADIDFDHLDVYDIRTLTSLEEQTHDSRLQIELGVRYFVGKEIEENPNKAFGYFRSAELGGNEGAYYYLGICFEAGFGCNEDVKEAFYYYSKAAETKECDEYVLKDLAKCYLYGKGTEENDYKAVSLLKKACIFNSGCDEAQKLLADC